MQIFLVVLARDAVKLLEKTRELDALGYSCVIVCGEKVSYPNVVYRQPMGKFDAINFGLKLVPSDCDVVALNDVDTRARTKLEVDFNQASAKKNITLVEISSISSLVGNSRVYW